MPDTMFTFRPAIRGGPEFPFWPPELMGIPDATRSVAATNKNRNILCFDMIFPLSFSFFELIIFEGEGRNF